MNPQILFDLHGRPEYMLVPMAVYETLKEEIDRQLALYSPNAGGLSDGEDEMSFPEPFIKNPITRMRMRADLKQKDLAELLGVTQAYVSKVENSDRVSARAISRVRAALQSYAVERAEAQQRHLDPTQTSANQPSPFDE